MGVSTGIATAAAVQSSIAAQQAHEAQVIACQKHVKGFNHDESSSTERLQYAECVRLLEPRPPMSSGETLLVKAVIVLLLLGMVVGGWRERDTSDGPWWGAMFGLMFAFFWLFGIAMVSGALYFLVTG